MGFPQASFDDEFTEGDIRSCLIESDDHHVEVAHAGQAALGAVLPGPGAVVDRGAHRLRAHRRLEDPRRARQGREGLRGTALDATAKMGRKYRCA